jgi:hypothetical protein
MSESSLPVGWSHLELIPPIANQTDFEEHALVTRCNRTMQGAFKKKFINRFVKPASIGYRARKSIHAEGYS